MPSNQDYDDDDKEREDDDDDFKLPTPHLKTPRPNRSLGGYDDAGLNSMLGNLAISPRSATVAAHQNSRGPVDADAPLHDSHTLCSLAAKFANVYALDPDNQATHPPSVQAFYVNGCKVRDANTNIDKLVVMMQVANPDDIEYVTGKLSNNKK
jgi:hypothetical protein